MDRGGNGLILARSGGGTGKNTAESDDVLVGAAGRCLAIAETGPGRAARRDAVFLDHALTIIGLRRAQACTAGSLLHMNHA
jgi:hypothetical protein